MVWMRSVVSPHKIHRGPGASGVLILRRERSQAAPARPARAAAKVRFVSPGEIMLPMWSHEKNRPRQCQSGISGRTTVFYRERRQSARRVWPRPLNAHRRKALAAWRNVPGLTILGTVDATACPFFSFMVRDRKRSDRAIPQLGLSAPF